MGGQRRRRALAPYEVRLAHERGRAPARRAGDGPMRPLADLDARGVRVVLFDVDDTLTTQGKLLAEAYVALEALHRAGLRTVAVSGRAAGFCEYAARMWPVDAVVGENGGFWFRSVGRSEERRVGKEC